MAVAQTVELRIPVTAEADAGKINATLGVFQRMAQKLSGMFAGANLSPINAGKMNAELKTAQGSAKGAANSISGIGKAAKQAGADSAKFTKDTVGGLKSINSTAKETHGKLGGLGGVLKGAGFAAAAAGAVTFGKAMIDGNAQMETYTSRFTTMLGSTEKAAALMEQLKVFGESTPYEFPELAAASSKLLAFGFTAEQIQPQLAKVGDVASGVGADIGELSEIYGKARVQGTLMAEDINQLVGRGIPVIQEFAKQMGVSEGEVKKLASEGKITFQNLDQAFTDLTAKGGQFNGMMEAQSKTFAGMMSTVQDVAGGVVRELGGPLFEVAKTTLGELTKVLQGPEVKAAVQSLGGAIGSIMSVVGTTIGQLLPLILQLLTPLASLIQTVLEPVGKVLGAVFAAVTPIIQGLIPPLTQALTLIGGLVQSVLTPIADVLQAVLPQLLGPITTVFGMLSSVFQILAPLFQVLGQVVGAVAPILQILVPIYDLLTTLIKSIQGPVLELVGSIAQLATTLLSALVPVLNLLIPIIAQVVGWIAGALGKGLGLILGLVVGLVDLLVGGLADALTFLIEGLVDVVEWIMEAASAIGEFLSPVIEGLGGLFGWLVDIVVGGVVAAFEAVIGWFSGAADTLSDSLAPAIEWVSGAFETLIGWITGVVSWVTDAIAKFMGFSGAADAAGAATNIFAKAIEWVQGALGVVNNIIKGAVAGFESLKKTITQAWEQVTSFDLAGAFSTMASGLFSAAKAAKQSGEAISAAETEAEKNARATAERVKKSIELNRTVARRLISDANLASKKTVDEVNAAITPVIDKFRQLAEGAGPGALRDQYQELMGLAKKAGALRIAEIEKAKRAEGKTPPTTKPKEEKKKAERSPLQIAKEELELRESNLKLAESEAKLDRDNTRRAEGRKETELDTLRTERERLATLQKELANVRELLKVTGEGADAKIGITLKEGEADDARKILVDAVAAANEQLDKVDELTLKIIPEIDDEKIRDLRRERLELDVSIGLRTEQDLDEFLQEDIELMQDKLIGMTAGLEEAANKAKEAGVLSEEKHAARILAIQEGATEEQLALSNQIAQATIDLKQKQYDRELALLDKKMAAEDAIIEREASMRQAFLDNLTRAGEALATTALNARISEQRTQIEQDLKHGEDSQARHDERMAELERTAAANLAAIQARTRGQALEAERQAQLEEMEIQRQRLAAKLALVPKENVKEAQDIQEQLDLLTKGIEAKGSLLTAVAGDIQTGVSDIFTNLFTGDAEAMKTPFKQLFGVLVGALQRLASAKITEVVLGLITPVGGFTGFLAALGVKPLVEGAINAILNPVFSLLTSFPTGGRFDEPTLALIGDGSKLGGINREWLFRDEQLRELFNEASGRGQSEVAQKLDGLTAALMAIADGKIIARGNDLVRVVDRTHHTQARRVINPPRRI